MSAGTFIEMGWVAQHWAGIWWCGDEVCDCYQPQVDLVTPNVTVGRPWFRRTRIWEGTFTSDGWDGKDLHGELEAACEALGISEGLTVAENVPWSVVVEIDRREMAEAREQTERFEREGVL